MSGDSYPMPRRAALTFALLLTRAAETAKVENVFRRFMEETVAVGEGEVLEMLRQFREFSARMAEDQFHRFE